MKDEITEAMKAAMKAGDKVRLSVLRMILAEIRNAELAGQEATGAVVAFGRRIEKSIDEYRRLGKQRQPQDDIQPFAADVLQELVADNHPQLFYLAQETPPVSSR